jgi:CO dehydrogenase nickel-insertion accessory protein CooC1
LGTFVAFSAVLLGGMAGMGSAATVSQVASSLLNANDPATGRVVVVHADEGNPLANALGLKRNDAVCWVTNAQASSIRAQWRTTTTTINTKYSLLTVYAPHVTVNDLRSYVSGGVRCQIVHVQWAFFLPIDGAVS